MTQTATDEKAPAAMTRTVVWEAPMSDAARDLAFRAAVATGQVIRVSFTWDVIEGIACIARRTHRVRGMVGDLVLFADGSIVAMHDVVRIESMVTA